jgi:hypothetical protein
MGEMVRTFDKPMLAVAGSIPAPDPEFYIAGSDGSVSSQVMRFRVKGQGMNIQLVRLDERVRAWAARPASPEELFMFRLIALSQSREDALHTEVQMLNEKLDLALSLAGEYEDRPGPKARRAYLEDKYSEFKGLLEPKSNGATRG